MTMTISGTQGVGAIPAATVAHGVEGAHAPLMPDPLDALACSGDPGAELAALAVKSGQSERKVTQALRDNFEKMEISQDDMEVESMRRKASDIRTGGLVEGLGTVVEGVVTYAGASEVSPSGVPTSAKGAAIKLESTLIHAETGIASTGFKGAEAGDDADAAMHKAAADHARSAAEDMHDAKKDASQTIGAAIDFFREYSSAKASEQGAAIRRA
jgi:hypothetical protein